MIVITASSFAFIPILAKTYGANNIQLSLLMTVNLGFTALGNLSVSRLTLKVKPVNLVYMGFILSVSSMLAAMLAENLYLLFLAQILAAFSTGINYPTLMGMSIQYVDNNERSTAMSLNQLLYSGGAFIGPWIGGILAESIGIRPMFGIIGVACFIIAILLINRYKKIMSST